YFVPVERKSPAAASSRAAVLEVKPKPPLVLTKKPPTLRERAQTITTAHRHMPMLSIVLAVSLVLVAGIGIANCKPIKLSHELKGHAAWLSCASYSQDGRLVLTAGGDNTARVWVART